MALSYVGPYSPEVYQSAGIQAAGGAGSPYNQNIINGGQSVLAAQPGNVLGSSTTGGGSADTLAFLNDQGDQLRNLLTRTDTGLSQGLTQNQDQYDTQVGGANNARDLQHSNYDDQRVGQNQGKLSAYDTINRNAGAGYRSLAQIIGRASGTGSSAFRDLLPNVIGKDTSSKRMATTDTFGRNLAGIDKSQNQYDLSYNGVLADLMKQKKTNEDSLRSGIEGQRQGINGQLGQNAAAIAQAKGGDYAAVKAAQTPFQTAIDNSRNSVEGFFSQFRTPYTPTKAVADAPNLADYTTDRSVVNQGNSGTATDPYSALLRKKLQGFA